MSSLNIRTSTGTPTTVFSHFATRQCQVCCEKLNITWLVQKALQSYFLSLLHTWYQLCVDLNRPRSHTERVEINYLHCSILKCPWLLVWDFYCVNTVLWLKNTAVDHWTHTLPSSHSHTSFHCSYLLMSQFFGFGTSWTVASVSSDQKEVWRT